MGRALAGSGMEGWETFVNANPFWSILTLVCAALLVAAIAASLGKKAAKRARARRAAERAQDKGACARARVCVCARARVCV